MDVAPLGGMLRAHQGSTAVYTGPERRRHRVLVTSNYEYHCRDGVCLAVRSRRTGAFQAEHPAIGRHVSAGLLLDAQGVISAIFEPQRMRVGHRIWFSAGDEDPTHEIITSTLRSIHRPSKAVVADYMS